MNLREEIIKSLNTLSEEDLEGVWENINFIQEPGEVEPDGRGSGRYLAGEAGDRPWRSSKMAGSQKRAR